MRSCDKILAAHEAHLGVYLSAEAIRALVSELPELQRAADVRAKRDITGLLQERWKPIPQLHCYEVSSLGRVRRCQPGSGGNSVVGRILKQHSRKGTKYQQVELIARTGRKMFLVSRLVALAFHGPEPSPDHQAAHYDGDPLNNREDNVRWATPLENAEDKRRHGRVVRGAKHWAAKLSEKDGRLIADLHAQGVRSGVIAKQFAVTRGTINRVIRNSRRENP